MCVCERERERERERKREKDTQADSLGMQNMLLKVATQTLLLWSVGSGVACEPQNAWASVVWAHGLSSCGSWTFLLQVMWDLSSPTRDRPRILCIARWILNCWTLGKS